MNYFKYCLLIIVLLFSLTVKADPFNLMTPVNTYCLELNYDNRVTTWLSLTVHSSDAGHYFPLYGIHIDTGDRFSPAYGNAVLNKFSELVVSITTSSMGLYSRVYTMLLDLNTMIGTYQVIVYSQPQAIQEGGPDYDINILWGNVRVTEGACKLAP